MTLVGSNGEIKHLENRGPLGSGINTVIAGNIIRGDSGLLVGRSGQGHKTLVAGGFLEMLEGFALGINPIDEAIFQGGFQGGSWYSTLLSNPGALCVISSLPSSLLYFSIHFCVITEPVMLMRLFPVNCPINKYIPNI